MPSSSDLENSNYELKEVNKKQDYNVSTEQENEIEYFETLKGKNAATTREEEYDFTTDSTSGRKRHGVKGYFRDFIDSFKPAENPQPHTNLDMELVGVTSETIEQHKKDEGDTGDKLKKTIQPRHVILISLGTGIGTGLLVGNGATLAQAGPAGLVIGYGIMGSLIYCIIQACGEMAVNYLTLVGGFNAYPTFLIDPGFSFATAWVYCLQWLCVCPLELVTASMTIKYWTTKVDPDVFVIIFYVFILGINILGGARGYAEAEFIFNSCKILMMIGFFILGIIIICGGAGTDGYIGGRYWHDPGAFRGERAVDRFKGVVATLVTAAFSFGQSEFIAVTASEQSNPRRAIPSAAKKIIYRALCIYLASIILLGFLVPYNSSQLLGAQSNGIKASPYVLAVANHGVRVVPHFINAVIIISVLSVSNSAFYSSPRMLLTLSQQGFAPKIFSYVDRAGRPTMGIIVASLFAVIAFCATSPKEDQVFTWLLAVSGLSQIFTWMSICLSHLRFRRAMTVQGRSLGECGFLSQVGIYGSAYSFFVLALILVGQFWVALKPVGSKKVDANSFFENYLAAPIWIALYIGYKCYTKDWRLYIKSQDIDLVAHRQIYDEDILRQEREEETERLKNGPYWKRAYSFWC
ncbi:amino acid transporter AGP1 KNAG_0C00590 [Huiozyma naganishii CBS 8797]|uniref:Amino acid permease/ SLC12A domain-containing protein n=1 Tax=Huiozyma naganishii (strain ATCC MYA-139 / BCRC 22969 / CBS 8797 / KCTC 17520 / NBRC 10181 / NCYC 3082 / Yp74L-3) TaxID=1071383 RepID=J7RI00_HUIN7|nr:hypothetical protein KNAG_0C00590 [Kazachstania naganishii CBS 8797]CCK69173.1 hypothetical protein KNAG_0C00590 [Kazachstania naganishii CBS 8797]